MVRFGCILVICAASAAQTPPLQELSRALVEISTQPRSQETKTQFAATILRFAETPHIPSQEAVDEFAASLARSLATRKIEPKHARSLAGAIDQTLHSAGISTYRFHGVLNGFRQTLELAGIARLEAQKVTDRLRAVGESVRGPQDLPVLSPALLRRR